MTTARIRYAGVSYYDRTAPLERGEVQLEGLELEYVPVSKPTELFRQMAQDQPFEASEMSLSTYLMMRSRGDERLVGIPVFPSRSFRHGQIYVSTKAGIRHPTDLIGRRVGIAQYQMTAALWVRAFLQHDYDVAPEQLRWRIGGLQTPGFVERLRHEPPPGVQIERIPEDRALEPMLADGEIDALVTTDAPDAYRRADGVERLFRDYRSVEQDYYRRTRLFPIMHLVVLRRDVYEAHPDVALVLLAAFEESKRQALARLRTLSTLAVMHPWLGTELAGLHEFFDGDPFAYGYQANRETLDAVLRFSIEQGLASRELDARELFAPETWSWEPTVDAELRI